MTRQLVVISAGLSVPSTTRQIADRIAESVTTAVTARGESLDVRVIEVRELANDLAQAFSTGISSAKLDEVKRHISAADGLIAVTPVFKASYTGLFKMLIDVLDQDALNDMPVLIAATAGTARHSLVTEHALRPLFSYMHAVVVPTSVFAATDDFGAAEGSDIVERIRRAAGELASLMVNSAGYAPGFGGATVGAHRTRTAGVDPDENITPFTELLKEFGG
ncbi:FMN reductase [Corynebacterium tapiri]|uniref:Oxidoreductase n=1 Tax=Corynebacterium tapiri TaxID=1448266 RepID=A0A5C4U4V2_9CORY|nr:FMN reductase [Corynebacterium tapiri]TNL97759.1 oxidoreductase [Corynebacterium tapiri]